ncbi:hypothetical protein GF366_03595 [Candidatus Peregrinibacteria bacterium]|nr:hypothetical protein [Candidatus Peregrinibacteria bacterium]
MLTYKIQKAEKIRYSDPKKLSDQELYKKCQEYGMNAKVWLRRFAGLLPEVNKRKLYRKKGFISIHEFAKKLCGMSEFTVERILNLSNRLEDKPNLKAQFQAGIQGWSKIETVSFIATPKTEKNWAEKVEKMSKRVLETYVSHYRKKLSKQETEEIAKNLIPGDESKNIPNLSQELKYLSFQLSREIEHKLRLFKQKIEKQKKENLSWNEVFQELLIKRTFRTNPYEKYNGKEQRKIQNTKNISKSTCNNKNLSKSSSKNIENLQKPKSRAIPSQIKRFIRQKYGTKCAYPNCNKPFTVFHHTKRFAISKKHDPKYIVPLCDLHHGLVHTGLIANETDNPENWRIKEKINKTELTAYIDQRINDFKPG